MVAIRFFCYNNAMSRRWKIANLDVFIRRQPRVVFIVGVGLLLYVALLLGKAFWANYQVNSQIKNLRLEIVKLEENNQQLQNYIAYYRTDAYREKALRQKLNYQKPGETVVATPRDNPVAKRVIQTEEEKIITNRSNWQKWIAYFLE